MAWILRLVNVGTEGEGRSRDVMEIERPDDIAEVIRLADLHDVHAGTPVPGCRPLQNPLHAPPPV